MKNVSIWQLDHYEESYGEYAGWYILVSPDGEDEVEMDQPVKSEAEAIAYAEAQGWTVVPLEEFVGQGPTIITGPHANVDVTGTRIQSDPVPVTGPLPEWAKDGSSLPRDKWFAEARRAARIMWAYEELVDDWEDNFEHCFVDGADPIEIVKQIGESLGLRPTNITLAPR